MKKTINILLIILIICGIGLLGFFRSLSWEHLISGATSPDTYISTSISHLSRAYIRFLHPIPVNSYNEVGQNPLIYTISGCAGNFKSGEYCLELLEEIITTGADVNAQTKDNLGLAPLHLAVLYNDPELTNLLLQAGADANVQAQGKRYKSMTPLRYGQELKILNQDQLVSRQQIESALIAAGGHE